MIPSARNAHAAAIALTHGMATSPDTKTGCVTDTFGSPATVMLSTSPPVSSRANACTAYSSNPVTVSVSAAGVKVQPLLCGLGDDEPVC